MRAKRAILIGLDGAIPEFVLRFREKLPALSALMEKGVFAPALPSPPVDTPTNWTTIATGAWAGTHGIIGFFTHIPGEPFDRARWSFNSRDLCQAEYLWESLERGGMRSILVNYPVAWPPRTKEAVIIGGDGPFSPVWMLSNPTLHAVGGEDRTNNLLLNYDVMQRALRLSPAAGWANLPPIPLPILESEIYIEMGTSLDWGDEGIIVKGEDSAENRDVVYHLLVYAGADSNYSTVAIAREKDFSRAVATLREGEWSPWVYVDFPGGQTGSLKFKLLELSADASSLRLYQTESYNVRGWTYPEELAGELVREVGPYHEGWEHPVGLRMGWFGPEIVLEQIEMQMDWMAGTCQYLTRQTDWNLLMLQVHVQDYLNHEFLSFIQPGYPGYNSAEVKKTWELFEKVYALTDRLVGRIVADCADEETLVVVLSDHGGVPVKTTFHTVYPFVREGLVRYKRDPGSGDWVMDMSRSKVIFHQGFWVNLKGREPAGIVEPAEYEQVRESILRILHNAEDPETGSCPYAVALRREDAEMLGLWGERVPDVVQFLKPGYRETGFPSKLRVPPEAVGLSPEELIERMSERGFSPSPIKGAHLSLPNSRLGEASCRAFFVMAGPGVKQGVEWPKSINLVDVAPTIAHLIGAPQPAHADGKILAQFLT